MRVVAYAPYPIEGPSTRFRLAQFVEPLGERGVELMIEPFFSPGEYAALYDGTAAGRRAAILFGAWRRRAQALGRVGDADAVLVHRELAPLGSRRLLRALRRSGRPLAYDFDDAVYLRARGGHPALQLMRRPAASVRSLCRAADLVMAGNAHLAAFARRARAGSRVPERSGGSGGAGAADGQVEAFAPERADPAVRVVPTVIDTVRYAPPARRHGRGTDRAEGDDGSGRTVPTIGWIGTHSTLPYLESLLPALARLQRSREVRVLVVCNRPPQARHGARIEFRPWQADAEVDYLHDMSVGVYPLPDDPWTRGKCGFKAIQYMACGVPVVASPVGVLPEILDHGGAGLLATDEAEWCGAIERLLDDDALRDTLARKGRERVVARYSVTAMAERMAELLTRLAAAHAGRRDA